MNQEAHQPSAKRSIADLLRISFPVWIALSFSIATLVAMFYGNGQSLTPEPKSVELWAEVIGAILGVVNCAVVMSVRPRTWQTTSSAIAVTILSALLCWMMAWIIISRIYQHNTFSGGDVKSAKKDIPILLAEISDYRGTHYNV